jgi:chromosome partitioning protein
VIPTGECTCSVCGGTFVPQFAFQLLSTPAGRSYLCSESCRKALTSQTAPPPPPTAPVRIAVLNQKGGVGKTTTAVSLASGLADRGLKTLLVDADAQGSVGLSLGVRGRHSLYHVMVEGVAPQEAAVPVRQDLDVITADDSLSHAEIRLAQNPKKAGVLAGILGQFHGYRYVVLDCAPALSLININALCFADQVLVPVSCDYLSLVALQQLLRTIKHVQGSLAHPVQLGAVLPTMYDGRSKHAQESLKNLRDHFGSRALPPIRSCVRLKEAPSVRRSIFEHAPESTGAQDYANVVDWAVALAVPQAAQPAAWPGQAPTAVTA